MQVASASNPEPNCMSWIKIVAGFVIMMAVVVVWFRVMKQLRGDSGSGMDVAVPKRRKRRNDEGANDLERFIQQHRTGELERPDAATTAPAAVATAALRLAKAPAAGSATQVPSAVAAPVLLAGTHRLLYLILKTGLPGHHVFPRVMLRDLVPAATARADVGAHAFAFVVCRADFSAVAAIEIAPLADSLRTELVERALAATGIRHLVLDAAALPRPKGVRALVYGS